MSAGGLVKILKVIGKKTASTTTKLSKKIKLKPGSIKIPKIKPGSIKIPKIKPVKIPKFKIKKPFANKTAGKAVSNPAIKMSKNADEFVKPATKLTTKSGTKVTAANAKAMFKKAGTFMAKHKKLAALGVTVGSFAAYMLVTGKTAEEAFDDFIDAAGEVVKKVAEGGGKLAEKAAEGLFGWDMSKISSKIKMAVIIISIVIFIGLIIWLISKFTSGKPSYQQPSFVRKPIDYSGTSPLIIQS